MTSITSHISHNYIKGTVLLMTFLLFSVFGAMAQQPDKRRVTPVKPETNQVKPPPKGTNEKIIQQYITGDSAAALQEARKDSLRRVYKRYPRLTDVAVGINLAEPLFMAFGQSYASVDVNATLNMWNRLQPTVELGLGWASNKPDDKHFTYRGKPSPYARIGANYNFMFKNSPDYQAIIGLRLGYSTFTYDVTGSHYSSSYWNEGIDFDLRGERSHALWGEAGIGLRVKLLGNISMGWMIRYHGIFDYGKSTHSRPWFIPGYGPRNSSLGFSLSVLYVLPFGHGKGKAVNTVTTSQPQ